ncbi:hypothetical protein E2C01_089928 [Portunus trituberculatus]|uniref:Uncharacterized protein n=1 Tax=Portunus trituberculatus TaxID=210409 RepID=A0A5B7JJJ9_PORTR|nr:hypothetical protein [Portunus trituberculatus]
MLQLSVAHPSTDPTVPDIWLTQMLGAVRYVRETLATLT